MFHGEKQDPEDGAGSQPSVMALSLAQKGMVEASLPVCHRPARHTLCSPRAP